MADDVLGTAYVVVRGITNQIRDDIKQGVNDAAKDAEKSSQKAGEQIGEDIGDEAGETASERISKQIKENVEVDSNDFKSVGHDIGDGISSGISEHLESDKSTFTKSGQKIGDDVSEGVERSGGLRRISTKIRDAFTNNRVFTAAQNAGRRVGDKFGDGIRDALARMDAVDSDGGGGGGGFMGALIGPLIVGIAALISGLIPVIGAAVGAVGALAAAFSGAALAAGVFGIGAMGFVKDLIEQYKAFQEGGLKEVDKQFRDIIGTIKDLGKSWSDFKEATRGPFLNLAETVLETVIGLMQKLVPVVNKVTNLFNDQAEAFRAWSQSSEFQSFINWIGTDGVRFLENFINIIKNVIRGLAGIIQAFTPLAHKFMDGFEDMTERFAEWGATLKDNPGFKDFVQYVRRVGPKVIDFLGALFDALVNIGVALAPVGEIVLTGLTKFLRFIADADPDKVRAVALAIGALVLAFSGIQALQGISQVLGPIATSLGALLGVGGAGGAAALVAIIAAIGLAFYAAIQPGEQFEEMMAALKDMFSEFAENAKEAWQWIQPLKKAFEDFISPVVQELIEQTAKALADLAPILKPLAVIIGVVLLAAFVSLLTVIAPIVLAFRILGKIVQWLGDLFNWLKAGLPGLAGAFKAVWSAITGAVRTAWNAIKGAVTAGMNAVKGAVQKGWNALKGATTAAWNAIKGAIQRAWGAIKGAVGAAVNAVKGVVQRAWNAIKNAVTTVMNAIKGAVQRAWNAIKSAVSNAINAIKNVVRNGLNAAKQAAQAAWNAIKSAAQTAWNAIKSLIQTAMNAIKSAIVTGLNAAKSAAQTAWNAIKSGAQTAWNAIKSIVQTAINAVKSAISGLRSAVQPGIDAFNAVKSAVESVTGAIGGLIDKINSIPDLPDLDVPGIDIPGVGARGGIYDKPTRLLIGEAGREVLIPLKRPMRALELMQRSGAIDLLHRAGRLNPAAAAVGGDRSSNVVPGQTSRSVEPTRGGGGATLELHVHNPSPEKTSYSLMKRMNEIAQLGLLDTMGSN